MTVKQRIICWIAYTFVRLLHLTCRIRFLNPEVRDKALELHPKRVVCYACWHQYTLSSMFSVAWRRCTVLVSKSWDGEVIAFINAKFGIHSARGSSSRGGRDGLRELHKLMQEGYEVGFTVDGPRGPRHKVKPGVVSLASRTGVAILPVIARGRRNYVFSKSWDRFHLPKPFTEVLVAYGSPIQVPPDLDDEAFRTFQEQVEEALHALEAKMVSLEST
jgi:lysophospholipid acyltransferase (LPLAT)-like uncharacterized protein